jgi:hypothetical protein
MIQAALVAIFLIGVVPLVVALTVRDAGLVALLLVAPLAPGAAVAVAYREWADPAGELSLATPSAGLRLVAMRALVVSLVALPLALAVLLVISFAAIGVARRDADGYARAVAGVVETAPVDALRTA